MSKRKKNPEREPQSTSEELEDLEATESDAAEVKGGAGLTFAKVDVEYKPQKP